MTPFIVCLKSNPDFIGTVINEHVSPIPKEIADKDGNIQTVIVMEALLSVLWEDQRSPAPCYHKPEELEWLYILGDEEDDDEDGEEEIEVPEELSSPETI